MHCWGKMKINKYKQTQAQAQIDYVRHVVILIVAALVFLTIGLYSGLAGASERCGQVPKVPWWGNVTHAKIRAYVQKNHQGNWDAYLIKWEDYLAKMQKGLAEGRVAYVKKVDINLKDQDLAKHVVDIEKRVQVIRCLMKKALNGTDDGPMIEKALSGANSADSLNDGQDDQSPYVSPSRQKPAVGNGAEKVYLKKIASHPGRSE